MLTCTPLSVFSWNYSVSGLTVGNAQLTLEPFSDQGAIAWKGNTYNVRKDGWINARWTLECDGRAVATAKRRGVQGRSFDIACDGATFLLKPQTFLTRDYHIFVGDKVVGAIEPEHPLTRKAEVSCESTVVEIAQLFSFWLVAMVWRSTTDTSPT